MSSFLQDAKLTGFTEYLTSAVDGLSHYQAVYEDNRHRVYSLAFWMTDNELTAEQVMTRTFARAFTLGDPNRETIDRALMAELCRIIRFDALTLDCAPVRDVAHVRRNTRRVDLERAVVRLPHTERLVFLMHDVEAYNHRRIASLLGLTESQSQKALHQARLRIRELLARSRS